MRFLAMAGGIALTLATGTAAGSAQARPATIDELVRSAKSAAGLD
jgi:hypothetical protein